MLIIAPVFEQAKMMLDISDAAFNESQLVRMRHIDSARQAGEEFLHLKNLLKAATPTNPLVTDMGTYSSFTNFLEQNGLCRKTIDNYIVLAENWDIVLKLGMQDADNVENLGNSMRVCRTLKIIRWFKKNLKAGRPEEELTIKQYWLDEESNTKEKKNKAEQERLKYDELQYRFHIVNKKLEHALNTIDELKAENESLKSKLYAIA